jgi:catechol 2,3-dioxygenase-like lactoylglutathione lyase family enzyme
VGGVSVPPPTAPATAPAPGVRPRVSVRSMPIAPTRIFHVNVNCSDLDRSLAFYTELVGLTRATRTTPGSPQPGGAFGLDLVQWDAWILKGDAGYESPVLDLLEWKVPAPCGRPAVDPTATGFNRLGFTTPDLDA